MRVMRIIFSAAIRTGENPFTKTKQFVCFLTYTFADSKKIGFSFWDLEGVLGLCFWDLEGVLGLCFWDLEGVLGFSFWDLEGVLGLCFWDLEGVLGLVFEIQRGS